MNTIRFTLLMALTASFVDSVRSTIDSGTKDGGAISRGEVCDALGMDRSNEGLISLMLAEEPKMFPEFEINRGPRGITRVGAVHLPKVNVEKFPEGFIAKLAECCEKHVPTNPEDAIRRSVLAKAMDMAGSETEALISDALSTWRVPGFGTRRGIKGGVCRMTEAEYQANQAKRLAKIAARSKPVNVATPTPVPEVPLLADALEVSNEAEEVVTEALVVAPVVEAPPVPVEAPPIQTAPVETPKAPAARKTPAKKPAPKVVKKGGRVQARA